MTTAYCFKCKHTRELEDVHTKTAGARTMTCGTCKTCGGKCCRFGSKGAAAPSPEVHVPEAAVPEAKPKPKRGRVPRPSKHLCPVCMK